ncbi:degenerin-like protein del-10 [Mytilus edulis]|uniref:degenerin-like protein del-10 n=1 Tax=Mytilus edulis TaxID=6550 RepID=UPI0039EFED78
MTVNTPKEMSNFGNINYSNMDIYDNHISEKKEKKHQSWRDECYQFAQETTLHGLKYISLRDAFVFRRLFWFVLTCSCCGIMSYQIIDRIIYYYNSPITVNVKVNYNRSLVFPSVTICNQNAFRSTAAAENKWYRLIETMYNDSSKTFDSRDLVQFNASKLSISEMFKKTGHTKEDMIVGCSWAGVTCTHEDFEPILTDHGLCYTFKPKSRPEEFIISSTGADHGLKLFLNVEQYEYMPGPNDAAGIKLLTYDKSDIPRIKELGMSVPTGIHAFVGLKLIMINNLHVPYGECQETQLKYSRQYSVDACIIECLNQFTQKKCGCRNFFIPSTTESGEECTMEAFYSCYKNYYGIVHDTLQDQCHCPTACKYSVFDPIMSYASTSEYTAEKKLTSVSTSKLQEKILNSREISNRMEKRKYESFSSLVKNFERSFDNVIDMLQNILKRISVHLQLIDSRYSNDKEAWYRKSYLYRYQIYHVTKNFIRPRDAMEERTLSNLCVGFHEFVFMIETNLKHLSSDESLDKSTRESIYTRSLDFIRSQIETAERASANISQLYEAYQNGTPIFRYRFGKTARKHNDYITPKRLLVESLVHNTYARRYAPRVQTDIAAIKSKLNSYISLLDEVNVTGNLNLTTMASISLSYIDKCEDFYHSKSVFYAECIERPKTIIENRFEKFKKYITDYIETKEFIESNLNNLRDSIQNISMFEVIHINIFMNKLTQYLKVDSRIKKNTLADTVLSDYLLSQFSRCEAIFQEIRNRGQNIYDGWTVLVTRSTDMWTDIINDPDMIPYYHHRNYSPFLVNLTDFSSDIYQQISETRNQNDLRAIIGETDKKLGHHFEALKQHMVLFKSSIKIDQYFLRENFLQLDVFYRELSYEEIDQQEAYDIFGLLCDIGGSMGLFIGASVMTMFELVDFVMNISAERAIRSKRFRVNRQ